MKTTNKILLTFLLLILAGITIIIAYARLNVITPELIVETGNITTKQFDIQDFNEFEAAGNIHVVLQAGELPAMTVTADESFVALIKAESQKEVLKIDAPRISRKQKPIEIELTYSDLEALNLSGGARLTSKDTIFTDNFEISIMAGSRCDIDIVADNLKIRALAGVHAEISGRTDQLEVECTAGSEIHAGDLRASIANLRATAGASIIANVTGEINATANSGASIRYSGEGVARNISSSSGGSVIKQ